MRLQDAVHLYCEELGRRHPGTDTKRKYETILDYFLDDYQHIPVEEITDFHIRKWLSRWSKASPATIALHTSIVKRFFDFMLDIDVVEKNPAAKIQRPKIPRPEDRDVLIVSQKDVKKLWRACESWADLACLGLLAYTASRRNAVSRLRWRDVDLEPDPPYAPLGWITFHEKGTKVTKKPILPLLREILDQAPALIEGQAGRGPAESSTENLAVTQLGDSPSMSADEYVVPNFQPSRVTRKERDNRIIYDRVKRIAERAQVEATVHAIRAAFSVFFLEMGGSITSLKEWLGHERLDTTQHYLRGLSRSRVMTEAASLDWGQLTGQSALTAPLASRTEGTPSEGYGTGRDALGAVSALLEGESCENRGLGVGSEDARNLEGLSLERESSALDSLSESASRHEDDEEKPQRPKVLPADAVKAHTGFEPVLPANPPESKRSTGNRHLTRQKGSASASLPSLPPSKVTKRKEKT